MFFGTWRCRLIESAITCGSTEELKLNKGDTSVRAFLSRIFAELLLSSRGERSTASALEGTHCFS